MDYVSADIAPGRAMVEADITAIPYPDSHFDVIICSHVLEHIPDDRKAVRELARVLAHDGWALLVVPMPGELTFEDPSIVTPGERLKAFGQEDHVRIYGKDFPQRLFEEGFDVVAVTPKDILSPAALLLEGIPGESEPIHRVTVRRSKT